jgi:hypothetical protein
VLLYVYFGLQPDCQKSSRISGSFIKLIPSEHVRYEHISIQLDTLPDRFLKKEINPQELSE